MKREVIWNHLLPYLITIGAALLAVVPHRLHTFNSAYPPNTLVAFFTAITMFLNAALYLAGPILVSWDTHGANAYTRTLLLAGGILTGCLIFVVWVYPLFWLLALYGIYRWHKLVAQHSWQRLSILGRSLMIAFVLTPAVVVWNWV